MADTEVGYGGWRKHTSVGLGDTFKPRVGKVIFAQTTGGLSVIIPYDEVKPPEEGDQKIERKNIKEELL